ncbi:MAG TPA: 3-dehydroquinate synthase [Candidatus Saccharimonadales bacterium]
MKITTVNIPATPKKNYEIHVSANAMSDIGSLYDFAAYSKVFIITDEVVGPLLLAKLASALPVAYDSIALPVGTGQKSIKSVQAIWTAMHTAGCDRKSLVINLGGGVIGDVGSFAASTYMRGLDFLNVPTTLLAQVDSSVGGKTGFNFDGVKNLIGTFAQPIGVVIDTDTLATLPPRELSSGFGEIIKHGLISDRSYFEQVTSKPPQEFSPDEIAGIIARSCEIKTAIVEHDETEGDARKLVNFGHTVGHAVEALSLSTDEPLLHGEAVGVGMVAEAVISNRLGKLPAADLQLIERAVAAAGLPTTVAGMSVETILQKMRSDKKNERGNINFTLLDGIGRAVYNQTVEQPVIIEALRAITGQSQ